MYNVIVDLYKYFIHKPSKHLGKRGTISKKNKILETYFCSPQN